MLALLAIANAYAQSEACAPYAVDRMRAELKAAEQALTALQVARGAGLLDEITDQARCLGEVVSVSDLGALGRLQAVRHFYEQDPEQLAGWAHLAMVVDRDGTWPIPDDHPVRRFIDPRATAVLDGPAERFVDHPRKGGVFLDGRWLEEARAGTTMPHLAQVFDANGRRVDGWWQDGGAFPAQALATMPSEATPPRWFEGDSDAELGPDPLKGWRPAKVDTAEAYASYLRKHPTGEHAAEARRRLDDKEWEAATGVGTPEAAKAYLQAWPDGRNLSQAEQVLEGEAFAEAVAVGTREALVLFRGSHPRGAYASEADRRIDDMAWAAAAAEDTQAAYARYRLHHSRGGHIREARLAQEELEWQAALREGTDEAMRAFVEAWPAGTSAQKAGELLAGARFKRIFLTASGSGADEVAAVLRDHVKAQGFEVVLAGSDATPEPGTAVMRLVVSPVSGSQGLRGSLELRVAGLTAPVSSLAAKAAEPTQLGRWLADALPPLAAWRP